MDARVPREERDTWPLVFAGDRLAWVPGVAVDADHASVPGQPALHVTVIRSSVLRQEVKNRCARIAAQPPRRAHLSRFPRSSLFYFALVVLLGLVFWFTWQSIQGNGNTNDWTYSQLVTNAGNGQVKSLEINGADGIATDSNGKKHNVTLPDCTGECAFVTELYEDRQGDPSVRQEQRRQLPAQRSAPEHHPGHPHRRVHVVGAPPDAERQQPGDVVRTVSRA